VEFTKTSWLAPSLPAELQRVLRQPQFGPRITISVDPCTHTSDGGTGRNLPEADTRMNDKMSGLLQ